MNISAIIQARMDSKRLPGKVLKDIQGSPMLNRVVERVSRSRLISSVLVATTIDISDTPVVRFCEEQGIVVFRGDPLDVLDRYYKAAEKYAVDLIVRITADCPLIDPGVIDEVIRSFIEAEPPVDLAANRLPEKRSYPIGLDTEVVSFKALRTAWEEADQPYEREHVLPFIYERRNRFKVLRVDNKRDYGHLRWTVDEPEDLDFVREVYTRFTGKLEFSWLDILQLLEREPSLTEINAHIAHRTYQDADTRQQGKP